MAMTAAEKKAAMKAKREAEAAAARADGQPTEVERINEASIRRPDAVADAHGAVERPGGSGDKVIVGLKLGVAYYDIQLCRPIDVQENTQTGPRTIKQYERTGRVVRLRGTAYPRGTVPEGFPERPTIVDGAALNFGVDRDFWEAWVEQNRLNPLVINRMIFAHADLASARSIAGEHAETQSGLEPVNPKGDRRVPRPTRNDVSPISTEESRSAKIDRAVQAAGG